MPSPQYSKTKGREWENAVTAFLVAAGWPNVERRRLQGSHDRGDHSGIPGVVIESKHERSYKLPQWSRETLVEGANDGADVAVTFIRQNSKPGAENGFVMMDPEVFTHLLRIREAFSSAAPTAFALLAADTAQVIKDKAERSSLR